MSCSIERYSATAAAAYIQLKCTSCPRKPTRISAAAASHPSGVHSFGESSLRRSRALRYPVP
eukprot:5718663-Alexandrium_andersonii.AAC.1